MMEEEGNMHLLLFLIGYLDMREKRIPDPLSFLLFCWFFLERPFEIVRLVVAFFLFLLLYLIGIVLFKREVMGFGDVKLMSLLVYGLDGSYLEFLLLSFFLAGAYSLLLLFGGRKKEESFAFAPFLVLSFLFYFH